MEQGNNPGQLILTVLLDEIRKVIKSELSSFRETLQSSVASGKTAPDPKRFYTLKEAAVELNLSPATVRRLIDSGLLRPSRATRDLRISNDQLEAFARSRV
jgi:excisionase family DNA binding protein